MDMDMDMDMETETETDVLIVGAGPTGSTLAAVLAARNLAFEIVDAAPGPERESSRATSVHAATLELLDRLDGLGQRLAERLLHTLRPHSP